MIGWDLGGVVGVELVRARLVDGEEGFRKTEAYLGRKRLKRI